MRAEWEKQRAVLMAFPHQKSDWADFLQEARENFIAIARNILRFEDVVMCVDVEDKEGEAILQREFAKELQGLQENKLRLYSIPCNDTWARDFGAINLEEHGKNVLLDFMFNGWGLKFASNWDNQINLALKKMGEFGEDELRKEAMILEGGSIESDGRGAILTHAQCLLEANRNPWLTQEEIENKLKNIFGVQKILWLYSGYLRGDDTDSHIDTLARFISPSQIAYVGCDDEKDEHYFALKKMEEELKALKNCDGVAYELIKLPFVSPIFENGERLPATYANFLFINHALLVPTYGDKNDALALKILQKAVPDREVIGIPCQTLIKQHGSLHCVTMQLY